MGSVFFGIPVSIPNDRGEEELVVCLERGQDWFPQQKVPQDAAGKYH